MSNYAELEIARLLWVKKYAQAIKRAEITQTRLGCLEQIKKLCVYENYAFKAHENDCDMSCDDDLCSELDDEEGADGAVSDYFFGESTAEVQAENRVLGADFKIGNADV